MKQTHNYLIPDYFEHFSCKMGKCRSACCVGWPISFSQDDYFKLIGVDCSPSLRRKLDCAMHLAEYPTPEEYAQISPRYDGNCPLRLADGRCGLHAELGDSALAYICRLYPRGVRLQGCFECSCANSCEGVLELLLGQDEPIKFLSKELTFDVPSPSDIGDHEETASRQAFRLRMIRLLQDRSFSLPQRLMTIGTAISKSFESDDNPSLCGEPEYGLRIALQLLAVIDQNSNSMKPFGNAARSQFGNDNEAMQRYHAARERFEQHFPKWEIWFEHMLVNHMFFVQFPFQDPTVSPENQFLSLCAIYSVLRVLLIGWMADRESLDDLVDAASAAFRHIDHTAFDKNAAYALRELGCTENHQIGNLLAV